jgi:hypothetical protein
MSKRQSVTRLGDRTVGTPQLAEGAVTSDILDETVATDISDANAAAAAAAADAATALSTADGKNTIYRQTSQPTGGTYANGDLWFDSDDDNKLYRYSSSPSPAWTSFTLGNNALSNLSANKITAGTLDASLITVSNLNAGSITAGTLTGISIAGGKIDIGGADTTSFHVDTLGNVWIGGATYDVAPFKISAAGFVTSTNGATFSGSINSNGDASFAGGDGRQSYIQNDGRFQSITSGTVYAQMGQSGLLTNAINGATQSYIDFFGEYVGFRWNMTYGPNDAGWAAAFVPTGNPAANAGFSGVAYRLGSSPPQQYSYTPGFNTSDRRTKINIEDVDDDFEDKFLNQVKIYQFDKINYANDDDLHAYGKHVGVIADELREIFPQWETSISLRDPDGADSSVLRAVNYEAMIPALIWICQRFNTRINELEARLSE